jgi:hypothetical protein
MDAEKAASKVVRVRRRGYPSLGLLSIRGYSEKYPDCTEGSLRWIVFQHREAMERCGALVYINGLSFLNEAKYPEFILAGGAKRKVKRAA